VHRKWVVNSSPLIILGKLSSLFLFERMCPNLVIPEGVAHELDQGPDNDPARVWILREGANHSIYTKGQKVIPIKRHRRLDRITANELCKQAGLDPIF